MNSDCKMKVYFYDTSILQMLLLVLLSQAESAMNSSRSADILKAFDSQRLDLVPLEKGKQFTVQLGLHLRDMVPLTFINNHIYVEMDLRTTWRDPRLSIGSTSADEILVLQNDGASTIWKPDIYVVDEKGVKHETFPETQASVSISPNGTVRYFKRLSITVSCPMSLAMFPFDRQTCPLVFESYTFNVSKLMLELLNTSNESPVVLSDSFRVSKFILDRYTAEKSSTDYGMSGVFDRIEVTFYLKRDIRFYIMEYYFPVLCAVFLSFISFWIDCRSTPARVALPLTTFLTLISMLEHVRTSSKIYGAADALEIFLNVSNIFVFAVMVEYGIVGISIRRLSKAIRHSDKSNEDKEEQGCSLTRKLDSRSLITACISRVERWILSKYKRRSDEVHYIDRICRYLFPLSYASFLLIYLLICSLYLIN